MRNLNTPIVEYCVYIKWTIVRNVYYNIIIGSRTVGQTQIYQKKVSQI